MDPHPLYYFTFKPFLYQCIFLFIVITLCHYTVSDDSKFQACEPKTCGKNLTIKYPFWISGEQQSYCGYPNFEITCNGQKPILNISYEDYIIKDIFYENSSLRLANSIAFEESCPTPLSNLTLNRTPFNFISGKKDFFFWYNCSQNPPAGAAYPVGCAGDENSRNFSFAGFYEKTFMNYSCESLVKVPLNVENGTNLLENYTEILKMGLVLNWIAHSCSNCEASGGRCGFDNNEFVCFCRDKTHHKTCRDGSTLNLPLKIGIGFGSVFLGMGLMGIACLFYLRRKKQKDATSSYVSRSVYSKSSSMADPEKGDDFLGVQIFTYNELEKATNNFDSDKQLGDGGFGTVYYGKLEDGRSVAVKRLYESNYKRLEQFMNEVEILARLRHQNLVSLYGCTSRHSRELLLVYDYLPNGTVADHLHGPRAKPGALPWPTRLKIAKETASALTYLHASEIIHRDVKTNNILLDNNFCVKVADFGLSRLFPTDVTHISTAPQGTPGYVDPEYHQCYQLTNKSDVFSFGVVLIELISSKPAVDITRRRHEINLSNMAINKIQNKALHELVDPTLGFDTDYKVRKMINAVAELAFQCLQGEKDLRPFMADLLETLRGIISDGYDQQKAEEMDIPSDDIGLLQSGSLAVSPDSVTVRWSSTRTTPNTSS
ncbi:LEAF RUST 10 DISEASE-RESISTANCE LOCUS RECEPTOR-LIKE PROTEIN KINASE-like 1.2 isoform X2 [Mangifera indica]|uniref:LEAF RUST 10 DISEASE-RESISTANCE LOCUS RECEPTOR-LIKE PROTEIN KINASE-like 1.2 isoform X2 n=1 Tax=Mangifera indica TaxID=29780 RepID=UPI001CFA2D31|nr:LEAF RUST 10 DISEASE-RESISTANCE LOCUS RECEPTOR-LIKE PROTEIN KINASE-like 1.2 isoform X2 [Mangifera indica]